MFYQLLVENSRDYQKYEYGGGILQFVEPDQAGNIHALETTISADELARFKQLLAAVWHCITTLELPDIDGFDASYKRECLSLNSILLTNILYSIMIL